MTGATTVGIHHVGFTVPDVHATARFFADTLDFDRVGGKPDYPPAFVSDGSEMLTLWQAEDPAHATPFDRRLNIGLHHVALRVPNQEALGTLARRLEECPEVSIEFRPEPLGSGTARHMMCTIPGGLRVEFLAIGDDR